MGTSKHTQYVASDKPIIDGKERSFLEHIEHLVQADNRETGEAIVSTHRQSFQLVSQVVLNWLVDIGCAYTEKDNSTGGRPRLEYYVTYDGRELYKQFKRFENGERISLLEDNQLVKLWRTYFPNRFLVTLANTLMSDVEAYRNITDEDSEVGTARQLLEGFASTNHRYKGLLNPIAQAAIDAYTAIGTAGSSISQPNPHSPDEQSGGRISMRLTGYDAHNMKIIADHLGTSHDSYIITWLLVVGANLVLKLESEDD